MDKPRYTLDIVIAAPGTPLMDPKTSKQVVDENGIPQTSTPGHMFYVLHAPGQPPKSFGFAPKEHGSMNGAGTIMEDDVDVYKNPRHTRTLEISEEQYRKLEAFGSDPEKFGFSKHYQDVRNNCVDFTWDALNHAGIERKRSIDVNAVGGALGQLLPDVRIPLEGRGEGKDGYRPLRNIHGVDSIDPPFPNSELNRTKTHPMPERTLKQHLLSENGDIVERSGERLASDARVPGDVLHPLDQRVRAALGEAAERQGLPAGQQPELLAGHLTRLAVQGGYTERDALQVAFSSGGAPDSPGYVFLQRTGETASPDPAANRQRLSLDDARQGTVEEVYQHASVQHQGRESSRLAQEDSLQQTQPSQPRMG
ncbi:hypothetical protein [Stenotrophomonas tuberculopleuritidis]|uniref:hypothetical protein n=1 Tax=Stenotrophomonas tuberculopleuritidis TaxID=3055079 RepID=UPI0026E524C7|nr:hypothetical protein [Stenotrophomonas sp. 704A1]